MRKREMKKLSALDKTGCPDKTGLSVRLSQD